MKGPILNQGEIIMKLWKYIDEIKKFSEPLSQFQPIFGEGDSSFFKWKNNKSL